MDRVTFEVVHGSRYVALVVWEALAMFSIIQVWALNMQCTFTEYSVNILWTFSEHSVNIQ
jgi:hypothetical protein